MPNPNSSYSASELLAESPSHLIYHEMHSCSGLCAFPLAPNARVKVSAGDLEQLGEVMSGGSYMSQNDLRVPFGLGDHVNLDRAEVYWDGTKQALANLSVDRFFLVWEGEEVVSSKSPDEYKVSLPR